MCAGVLRRRSFTPGALVPMALSKRGLLVSLMFKPKGAHLVWASSVFRGGQWVLHPRAVMATVETRLSWWLERVQAVAGSPSCSVRAMLTLAPLSPSPAAAPRVVDQATVPGWICRFSGVKKTWLWRAWVVRASRLEVSPWQDP